jgi:hypothetical protein
MENNIQDDAIKHIKDINATIDKHAKALNGVSKDDISASIAGIKEGLGGLSGITNDQIDVALEMLRKRGVNI